MTEHPETGAPGNAAPAGSHDALAGRGGEPVSIGIFARRRAEMGLSHEDVANQLKFAPRFIEALEAGEFEKLPGRTFARGMLRSYAKLLKIDPAPFLGQLGASSAPQAVTEEAVSLRAPIPFSQRGRHVNLVYVVVSGLILVTVAFFAFEWYQEKNGPAKLAFVAPGQETPTVPVAAPAASGAGAPEAAAAPPARDARPATFASAGPLPLPETAPRVEAPNPGAPKPEALPPLAPGKGRIVMRFEKDSWVEIRAKNGQTLFSQLNPAGSEKTVEGEPPFQLTIGNAPNVHVTYNDQPVDLKPHFKVDVARLTLN